MDQYRTKDLNTKTRKEFRNQHANQPKLAVERFHLPYSGGTRYNRCKSRTPHTDGEPAQIFSYESRVQYNKSDDS